MSTAFHPQMDGATECTNCSIAQVLITLVHNDQKNWADMCPAVEFALNSNISATTGYTPFELTIRTSCSWGNASVPNTQFTGVKQFAQQALWNLMMAHD